MRKKRFASKLLSLALIGIFWMYIPTITTDSAISSEIQICSDFDCEPIKEN